MPATSFPEYAREIEDILHVLVASGEAMLLSIQVDQRSSLRGLIAGQVQLNDGSQLHIREFLDISLPEPRLAHSYHYHAGEGLIFRYDNATHRPSLPRAEHKHTAAGVQVTSAPTLAEVISEILSNPRR